MNYTEIIKTAKADGRANETAMWSSIESISDMLDALKGEHPELYWNFMRKQYGIMYSRHYGEDFANYDVAQLRYSDAKGATHSGAHWSVDQVESATSAMHFPNGTTKYDKYVAFNATYADFNKHFDESQILQMGFDFWFADEDWGGTTKIWDYMCAKSEMTLS